MDEAPALPSQRWDYLTRFHCFYACLCVWPMLSCDITSEVVTVADLLQLPLMFIHPANIRRLFEFKVRINVCSGRCNHFTEIGD